MSDGVHDRTGEIGRLLAKRRQSLSDPSIDDADDYTDDGEAVAEMTVQTGPDTWGEFEVNLTRLFRTAPSTTGDVDLLEIEAELAAERGPPDNPHIPTSTDVLDALRERLDGTKLRPAWEVAAENEEGDSHE